MSTKFTIEVASVPDRDSWIAEIWNGEDLIAEISRDDEGVPLLELYVPQGSSVVRVDMREFLGALAEAQAKLGL